MANALAYGRLDIFWPDGRLESVMLDSPTVSVGRAPGNVVTLETDTVSRYHFSITYDNGIVAITDLGSENGTFVDGLRLKGNEPRVLDGVEEIVIGQLRLIYHALDEAPTMPMVIAEEDDTQHIERPEANFRMDVERSALDVWPASSSNAELIITNLSDDIQTYDVEVTGSVATWVRINRPRLDIQPGETGAVLINVKPPRRADNLPAEYDLEIRVSSDERPDVPLTANLRVRVRGYRGFGLALARPAIDDQEPVRLFLHNQGNLPLTLRLRAKGDNLRLDLPTTPLTLGAGQRTQVQAAVIPRQRPLTGEPETRRFEIIAQAQDITAFVTAVSGQVEVAPRFAAWQLIAGAGIGLSLILLLALGAIGALTPRQPVINDFEVNSGQLEQGDVLRLDWRGENINSFIVRVNQAPLMELPGSTNSVEIDTSELSGEVQVSVQGLNPSGSTESAATIFIYRPLTIDSFSAEPAMLMRNVVTSLTLTWDVPGAIRTELSGLEEFTNAPLEPSYGPAETLSGLSGIATAPVVLSLRAEDEVGNVIEQRITLPVSDPTCIARSEAALYEGPNAQYQRIGTVPSGESVVVDAQDPGAGWLRMVLPGGLTGWSLRDPFVCDPAFSLENLRKEANFPPPPPTLQPTSTAPPTFTPSPTATPDTQPGATPTVTPTFNG